MTETPLARPEDKYDVIILGAGMSGLVASAVMQHEGKKRLLVIDEYPSVGGNHLDYSIGDYTFDIGSLIFQDDSPLLRWFPELIASYVPISPSWERLRPQGSIGHYPFSVKGDLLSAGPMELIRISYSVIASRVRIRRPQNAREYAEYWLGRRLAQRSGLLAYMARFCGVESEYIDLKFAESRMGWIAEHAQLRTHLQRLTGAVRFSQKGTATPPNHQLARPRAGFAELYAPAVRRLAESGATFRLGQAPDRITRQEDGFTVFVGDNSYRGARILSTIPVDHGLKLIGQQAEVLPTVTLLTLFYSFRGVRGFSASILYNFSETGSWKRLTVYSDFYGEANGRTFFAVEVVRQTTPGSAESADTQFRMHAEIHHLLDGDLRLEGHHVLQHAYPIYTSGSGARAQEGVRLLKDFGIESFGRQGAFSYQPTARASTREAEAALGVPPVDVAPMLNEG